MRLIENKLKKIEFSKTPIIATILFLLSTNLSFANVSTKVDNYFLYWFDLALVFVKWGGIFAVIGLAIFLQANNDETSGKRGKIAIITVAVATLLAWIAQPLINGAINTVG